ncbi:MAG TPA: response regulator transcription factor [Rickettsiales bacterium]|nr:response regulator transcription factor [Rickettsiales bacterium]
MNQKKNTILIIEDEPPIRKLFNIALEAAGYKTVECDSGKEGIRLAASVRPDLVILDLGLPDIDGKEVITGLREWSQVPIIVCSVRSEDEEVIAALETGADDYVTKPFNPDVLLARIHANLRKAATRQVGEPDLENGDIRMDLVRHEVFLRGEKSVFTPREYDLLRYFIVNRGKILTHKQILKDIWGAAHVDNMQYLRVYVSQLREKIEPNPAAPIYIVTEPGIGYRMEIVNVSEDAAA